MIRLPFCVLFLLLAAAFFRGQTGQSSSTPSPNPASPNSSGATSGSQATSNSSSPRNGAPADGSTQPDKTVIRVDSIQIDYRNLKEASTSPQDDGAIRSPQGDAGSEQPSTPPASTANVPPDSKSLEIVKKVKPVYPVEAGQEGMQGQVVVKIHVSETGDVTDAEIVSGNSLFTHSALEAAKKFKFKPFIRNGKPVKAVTNLTVDYAFQGRASDMHPPDITPAPSSEKTAHVATVQRIRVSSGVAQGLLIHRVQPVYPTAAKQARIQGTVVLEAIIGKDGAVKNLHGISGPKELVDAAIGAVEQWRYRPYFLQSEPVEVDTQIVVNFTLTGF